MNETKLIDWIAIEIDYKAGIRTLRVIGDVHGVAESTIRKRAQKHGWLRDPSGIKNEMVRNAMAGAQIGAQESAQEILRTISQEVVEDVTDMKRGLHVSRTCLANLVLAANAATEPKDIKVIIEATALAIDSIRKIRGLDEPSRGGPLPPPVYKIVTE
jgi:hypothetical protein